jgi:hydroxymethylpyrimidine pyrophosphatase-like HAD family hydrolase
VYLDLDSTLLGPSGSILRGADGRFTTAGIRALELLDAAGLPFVLVSGRSRARLEAVARMLGADGILPELGAGDAGYPTEPGETVHAAIARTGVPEALLASEPGLAPHPLATRGREASHVFLGRVGAGAEGLVRELSAGALRLADNGHTGPRDAHIFHLLPAAASKARAVAHDIARRAVSPEACLAVGDSAQDLDIGRVLGTVAIVANGAAADPRLAAAAPWVTTATYGAGVLEAVEVWLSRRR